MFLYDSALLMLMTMNFSKLRAFSLGFNLKKTTIQSKLNFLKKNGICTMESKN